ncbi:MAG: aminotransferase class I/II-fold pyridoxal phosphate-dependent enzyme [Bacteroidetes bacterium]|nr:MAG: aminotransferase class I/II-fold pyridoxal phosphate-dependent enzyme [Bacteroidota bacterium]
MLSNTPIPVVINQNLFGLSTSATVAINERSRALEKTGKTVYKLGFGQSPFPVPHLVVQALKKHAHEKDYLAVRGLPALREAISEFTNERKGGFSTAEEVLVGPGSKELMFLLQLSYYGEIVIPAPCWVSYAPQAQLLGRKVRRVQTNMENGLLLMPDQLEAICKQDPERPRLVILNYPANPTGTSYSKRTLMRLAEVARRYKVVILSDEIYSELDHRNQHESITQFYPEGTIVSGGLSKWCGAGGWRLGYFVFPESLKRLQDAMAICASETFTSTSAPIQYAAVSAFLGNPEIDRYLDDTRSVLAAVGRYVFDRLQEASIVMPEPQGGFYLFPDFEHYRSGLERQGITTDRELCSRLLDEAGVALLPGSEFGCASTSYQARLSYVDFDGELVLKACRKLPERKQPDDTFVETFCPRIVAGIEAMIDWLRRLN